MWSPLDAEFRRNATRRQVLILHLCTHRLAKVRAGMMVMNELSQRRDALESRNRFGKSTFSAFSSRFFRQCDPQSVDFKKAADLVRSSLPKRHGDMMKDGGVQDFLCRSTVPPLKIVAVHEVINEDQEAIYNLKKTQLEASRGAQVLPTALPPSLSPSLPSPPLLFLPPPLSCFSLLPLVLLFYHRP